MMNRFKIPIIASLLAHGLALISVSAFMPSAGQVKELVPLEMINFTADSKPAPQKSELKVKPIKESAPVKQEAKAEKAEPVKQVLPAVEKKAEPKGETLPLKPAIAEPIHQKAVPVKAASVQNEAVPIPKPMEAPKPEPYVQKLGKSDEVTLFKAMVKQRIEKAKYYPKWARERGLEGIVGVKFNILPDGGVGEVKVVRPCHCDLINKAACDAIKKAAPYGPRPKEIEGQEMAMEVNIGFKLE